MDQLPSSIAAYLEEAGFSGTEILILRRLMDGEPLTIRQLGAKTGKSTGVLDQAMKKLITKNIIRKTLINDAPKYTLDSLDAVVEWMQDDMEQKREMLLRRHQNFESFVTSLESGPKRPDIEYFEGESGIKQAYIKLLNGPGEILHYLPVRYKEEEDPLRDFRVQYFRERQLRKMFSRVLSHDTILGHRYQSRDAFEYRKTVLIPEKEYPFTFEKIITGERIACFDHAANTACVIRYPELADIERTLFEAIWRQVQVSATATKEEARKAITEAAPEGIARMTATMSQVREFFLSKKSLVAFGVCALLSLGVTALLYQQNLNVNMLRIQERVKSIAATAALQFDAADIEQIHTLEDVQKPAYAKLVHHLNRIRRENEGIKFAYILRPTEKRGLWKFIADGDAIDPTKVIDLNNDGKITEADHLSLPADEYVDEWMGTNYEMQINVSKAYEPYSDQWGEFISGTAPILNEQGRSVAVLGVDIETSYWHEVSNSSFWPIVSFISFFFLFVFIRLAAYNRALFKEVSTLLSLRRTSVLFLIAALATAAATLWFIRLNAALLLVFIPPSLFLVLCAGYLLFAHGFRSSPVSIIFYCLLQKKILYTVIIVAMGAYWIAFGVYFSQKNIVQEETGRRLMAIAATAASQFDPHDLEKLRFAGDMKTPEYQRVFRILNEIRENNPDIQWIYILRQTDEENLWEFAADADSNHFLSTFDDYNNDGFVAQNEVNVWPGYKYYYDWQTFRNAITKPSYSQHVEVDQWGTLITGAAPIQLNGETVAVLGVDIEISNL